MWANNHNFVVDIGAALLGRAGLRVWQVLEASLIVAEE